jgi:hypothetical protein
MKEYCEYKLHNFMEIENIDIMTCPYGCGGEWYFGEHVTIKKDVFKDITIYICEKCRRVFLTKKENEKITYFLEEDVICKIAKVFTKHNQKDSNKCPVCNETNIEILEIFDDESKCNEYGINKKMNVIKKCSNNHLFKDIFIYYGIPVPGKNQTILDYWYEKTEIIENYGDDLE